MINAADLSELQGRIALVCSAQDHRNPQAGRRGTVVVHQGEGGEQVVDVEIEFPQMFTSAAHLRRIRLSDDEIAQMLASERYGAFTVTLKDRLDPMGRVGNE